MGGISFLRLARKKETAGACFKLVPRFALWRLFVMQITSKKPKDDHFLALNKGDFEGPAFEVESYLRISRIFCVNESYILKTYSKVTNAFYADVCEKINDVLGCTAGTGLRI